MGEVLFFSKLSCRILGHRLSEWEYLEETSYKGDAGTSWRYCKRCGEVYFKGEELIKI